MESSADLTALDRSLLGATAGSSRTDWGQVRAAGDPASPDHARSLDAVVRRYWPIIYAYIRHSGHNEEAARDLTQGFLADVLFGRGLLSLASPSRGRFRSLLLRAVTNHLRDDHRRRTAGRRHPGADRVILMGPAPVLTDRVGTPERAFASAWVAMLVSSAAEQCRAECLKDGQEASWMCLELRMLRPLLHGDEPVSTDALAARTGLRSSARVVHALALAKRRFARLLLAEIGTTTEDPGRIHEEISELLRLLERERGTERTLNE